LDGRAQTCYDGSARDPQRQQINRLAVGPNGDLKFCNEAVRGVANLASASDAELDEIAALLISGDHAGLLESVDICTCRGKFGPQAQMLAEIGQMPVPAQ